MSQFYIYTALFFHAQIFLAMAAFFTVSLGGLTIGILFGIVTSFVTRYTTHVRGQTHFCLTFEYIYLI